MVCYYFVTTRGLVSKRYFAKETRLECGNPNFINIKYFTILLNSTLSELSAASIQYTNCKYINVITWKWILPTEICGMLPMNYNSNLYRIVVFKIDDKWIFLFCRNAYLIFYKLFKNFQQKETFRKNIIFYWDKFYTTLNQTFY